MTAYHGAPNVAREIAAVDVAGQYGSVYELLRQLALERPTEAAFREADASLLAMLKLLIDAGAPLEAPGTNAGSVTALFVAVHYDDLERTRFLTQAGADPHATGWGIGTAYDLARDKAGVGAYMASVCEGASPTDA